MSTYQQSYSRKASTPVMSQCENYPNQLENIAQKERFGLFSQPPGLSIGDHYSRSQKNAGPRGILTNPKLASSVEPSLFQFPNFTSINDPYKEAYKIKQINDKYRESNIPHNQPFKHTDNKKTIVGSEFEHMKEYDNKSYNTRKADGSVKTKPRGFYTQPGKKGFANTTVGHLFGHIPYKGDPYDRPKEFDVKERAEHKSKILHPVKPFISTQQRNNLFSSNNNTYGDKGDEQPKNTKHTIDYRGMTHPARWRPGNPAKKGFNKTISKFPEYYEEGDPRQHKKKVPFARHDKTWKPNSKGTFARPTPPISNLVTNFSKMTSFRH